MFGFAPISSTPISALLGLVFNASVAEDGTASEAVITANNTFNSVFESSAEASETTSSVAAFVANVLDSMEISDTPIAIVTFYSSVDESSEASETINAIQWFNTNISDTVNTSETVSAIQNFLCSVSSSVEISDTISCATVFNSVAANSAEITDSLGSYPTYPTVIDEAGEATSDLSVQAIFNAVVTTYDEYAITLPLAHFNGNSPGVFYNQYSYTDYLQVAARAQVGDAVYVRTTDPGSPVPVEKYFGTYLGYTIVSLPGQTTVYLQVTNPDGLPGWFNPFVGFYNAIWRSYEHRGINASDAPSTQLTASPSVSESTTVADNSEGKFLWVLVDDSQGSIWQAVDDSQTGGWVPVDDSQTTTWTEIVPYGYKKYP